MVSLFSWRRYSSESLVFGSRRLFGAASPRKVTTAKRLETKNGGALVAFVKIAKRFDVALGQREETDPRP